MQYRNVHVHNHGITKTQLHNYIIANAMINKLIQCTQMISQMCHWVSLWCGTTKTYHYTNVTKSVDNFQLMKLNHRLNDGLIFVYILINLQHKKQAGSQGVLNVFLYIEAINNIGHCLIVLIYLFQV